MLSLKHPYISVEHAGRQCYGGGQQHSRNAMVSECGCGIIAATDTLLYLCRYHTGHMPPPFRQMAGEAGLPSPLYDNCIQLMHRRFFPLIPHAGINGLMLMGGMRRFFRKYRMPFTAHWCLARGKMWGRIEKMLRADIPVIMSVGPNFPRFWGKERAAFYTRTEDGAFHRTAGARAHFFTVTGLDDTWLRISSWGRLYYLSRAEFEQYVQRHSAGFISNILYIERKNETQAVDKVSTA